MIEWIQNDPLDFEPGTDFHYNNSAYFILGQIIEKVSGKSYDEFLQTNYFKPLKMNSTGVYNNQSPPKNIANGYSWKNEKNELAIDWDMSWAGGAGALYSTTNDLMQWNEGLYNGNILQKESLEKLLAIRPIPDGQSALIYSYGLGHYQRKGVKVIGHSGGLDGWLSNLEWFPETQTTIVVLSNAKPCQNHFDPGYLSDKISRFYFKNEMNNYVYPLFTPPDGNARYHEYQGQYDYVESIQTITFSNSRLYAQLTGQSRFEIFPEAMDKFFFKIADAEIQL